MLMEFTVMEKPGEGGERGGIKDSFRFLLPSSCPQDSWVEMIHESSTYMSPQVLLPPALCLPHRSRLEGEASAGPR